MGDRSPGAIVGLVCVLALCGGLGVLYAPLVRFVLAAQPASYAANTIEPLLLQASAECRSLDCESRLVRESRAPQSAEASLAPLHRTVAQPVPLLQPVNSTPAQSPSPVPHALATPSAHRAATATRTIRLVGADKGPGKMTSMGPPRVSFASGTWHREANIAKETIASLVTLVLAAETPMEIVLLMTEPELTQLANMALVLRPAFNTTLYFVEVTVARVAALMRALGLEIVHHGGPMAYSKFFLPELYPSWVDKVILVDTDTLFGMSIHVLWERFRHFRPDTLFAGRLLGQRRARAPSTSLEAFGPAYRSAERELFFAPGDTGTGVCTCLLMLHLDNMRRADWYVGRPFLADALSRLVAEYGGKTPFGDQTMYNEVKDRHPHRVQIIPDAYIYSGCSRFFPFRGTRINLPGQPARAGEALWMIAHFNCGKNDDFFAERPGGNVFRRAYEFAMKTYAQWAGSSIAPVQ